MVKCLQGGANVPRRWGCGVCRRRHTWVPPYRGISKGAVKRGVGDAALYEAFDRAGFVCPAVGGRGGCRRRHTWVPPYRYL